MTTYSEFLPSEIEERDRIEEALSRYRSAEYRREKGQGMRKFLLWALAALALFLLAALSAGAQELPLAPGHEYAESREFRIDTAALAVAWTLDTISTHDWMKASPRHYEGGGLLNGSRSTPEIMGAWAAVDVGAVALSYEWKKHVHNRWLHPLWRVPLLIQMQGHTRCAIENWRRL
jgi:hypothetical protein